MSVSVPNSAQLELKGSVRLSFTTNQATQDMIFNQIPKLSFHIGVLHISAPGSIKSKASETLSIKHYQTLPASRLSTQIQAQFQNRLKNTNEDIHKTERPRDLAET